jgi:imidazole glycerol-phosphate synthase subunit HisF
MRTKRIVIGLEVGNGRIQSDATASRPRSGGDAVELAARYEADGADEILLTDCGPAGEGRASFLEVVERAAARLTIPLIASGPMDSADDLAAALHAGATRVGIKTSAIARPELITEAARMFGSERIVAGIDVRRERRAIEMAIRQQAADGQAQPPEEEDWYRVFTHVGGSPTQLEAVQWATQCETLGAGEILITNIDRAGSRDGYDLELVARIVEGVRVPVIAGGGAGSYEHLRDVFVLAGADAAIASAVFHTGELTVTAAKRRLAEAGLPVRPPGEQRPGSMLPIE